MEKDLHEKYLDTKFSGEVDNIIITVIIIKILLPMEVLKNRILKEKLM